jgi:hypothetical protein
MNREEKTELEPVMCLPCGGEGAVDGGDMVIVCPCCKGSQVLTVEQVEWFGLTERYATLARLEQEGASFVAAARSARGAATHPLVKT